MNTLSIKRLRSIGIAASFAVTALATPAHAQLTLTSAGTTNGFNLSLFAAMPSYCCGYGAWGSAVLSNGNVVVNGYNAPGDGTFMNYIFADVDGQSYLTPLAKNLWNDGGYASALATLNSVTYGTHYSDNTVRIVNLNGSEGAIVANVGRGGLSADQARGTLLAATNLGLVEIDPTNPNPATNFRVVGGSGGIDGVTVSPDGSIAYVEDGGHIFGLRISDGFQLYDSGFLGTPDGVGVITSGALTGKLIVNFNDGTLHMLDPTAMTNTVIANGGSRGDYVGFDPNGTLFVSQSDRLLRLSLSNGTIGGGGNGVPEPATWAMMIVGMGGIGCLLRRRRAVTMRARYA